MRAIRTSPSGRVHRRLCLTCGFDGPAIQGARGVVFTCPQCGEDLYTRPPRSYAELEGLDDESARREAMHDYWSGAARRSPILSRLLACPGIGWLLTRLQMWRESR